MNKREIDYYVSNGKFAISYLQDLSEKARGRVECNKAFNHALSVAILIRTVEALYKENQELNIKLNQAVHDILQLKQGKYSELLSKETEKLQEEFKQLKEGLISLIGDYPDIDY